MNWRDNLLNLFDTPGSELVAHEKALPVACADGVIVVVSAPDSIEVGTERALELASKDNRPRVIVVNKMDRNHCLDEIHSRLGAVQSGTVIPIQMPWYDHSGSFQGVICLFRRKLFVPGEEVPRAVPDDYRELVQPQEQLVEAVALLNDNLLEDYLEFI